MKVGRKLATSIVMCGVVVGSALPVLSATQWRQQGADIDGEATEGLFSPSIAMSSDGRTLAIGITGDWLDDRGQVRVYTWDGSSQTQQGDDIDGEAEGDNSGSAVAMSADGRTVAIGAPGSEQSHVRVFTAFDRRRASLQTVDFDPAGGTCVGRTAAWTVQFRGVRALPTDCIRDGYVFLGWTRDRALTVPENLITTISRSGTVTAVWGELPAAPSTVNVLANFLCRQNCDSALIIWPASNTITDTPIVTVDDVDATCTGSGEVFGIRWCWISGLTSGSSLTASVAWRNQFGAGPTTSVPFTLN